MKKRTKIIIVVILAMGLIGGIMQLLGVTPDESETAAPEPVAVESSGNEDESPAAESGKTETAEIAQDDSESDNADDVYYPDDDGDFHLWKMASIRPVMNGTGTERIGDYAFIEANKDMCTDEALADLYFNFVAKNNFNWCMVMYSDKDDNSGVYLNTGMIEKNVHFEKDGDGWMLGDTSGETIYYPADDGKTIKKM